MVRVQVKYFFLAIVLCPHALLRSMEKKLSSNTERSKLILRDAVRKNTGWVLDPASPELIRPAPGYARVSVYSRQGKRFSYSIPLSTTITAIQENIIAYNSRHFPGDPRRMKLVLAGGEFLKKLKCTDPVENNSNRPLDYWVPSEGHICFIVQRSALSVPLESNL